MQHATNAHRLTLLLLLIAGVSQGCGALAKQRAQADNYYQLAQTYLGAESYDAAEQAIRQALQQRDPPPSILVNYSTLLLLRNRPDEALELAHRALQDPGYDRPALVHLNMGLAYSQQGQLVRAVAQFRRALTYRSLPEAHHNLGLACLRMGRHDAATRAFGDAIRPRPTYTAAYAGLGDALLAAGQVDDAREVLEQVIALRPDNPSPSRPAHNSTASRLEH